MVATQITPTKLASRFEVLRPLAAGGMGEVSIAFDHARDDTCCIKSIPLGGDDVVQQRFVAEAAVLVALQSPHVVPLRAYGVDDGKLWYAMDRMDSSLYARRRAEAPVEPLRVTRWMLDALAGLEALHRRGIVHRDVKLANLLLDRDGRVRVADLGLARHPDGSVPFRTQDGRGLGTPDYAAPELFRDARSADHRADLFGVAVCAYELLTGEAPARFVLHPIEPGVLELVPEPYLPVLQRAGALKPDQRYDGARGMAEALSRAADVWASEQGVDPQGRAWMEEFNVAVPPLGFSQWWQSMLWRWGLR